MVLVVLWGAIVRTTGSGAGCGAHWPLCNGDFFPHHPRLATIIEFTHRSMTGILTTLVAILAAWVFWKRPSGDRSRRAVIWVVILLITEALLGAALVLGGYVEANASNARVAMQCIHFTNTMLLLAALTITAWWTNHTANPSAPIIPHTSPPPPPSSPPSSPAQPVPSPRSPTPSSPPPPSAPLSLPTSLPPPPSSSTPAGSTPPLRSCAFACVALLCWRIRNRIAAVVATLLALQFVLGIGDVLLLAPQWMQILHLLGADLFWIALVVLIAEVRHPSA